MQEEAKLYLESIVAPLTRGGVEILCEDMPDKPGDSSFEGITLVVVPKRAFESGALVGIGGAHVDALRTIMRTWSGVHTHNKLFINLMVAKPSRIRTEYVG